MVDSIKYWCDAFGLVDDRTVTPFAESLLDPQTGWDPCLEDDASLWLLPATLYDSGNASVRRDAQAGV